MRKRKFEGEETEMPLSRKESRETKTLGMSNVSHYSLWYRNKKYLFLFLNNINEWPKPVPNVEDIDILKQALLPEELSRQTAKGRICTLSLTKSVTNGSTATVKQEDKTPETCFFDLQLPHDPLDQSISFFRRWQPVNTTLRDCSYSELKDDCDKKAPLTDLSFRELWSPEAPGPLRWDAYLIDESSDQRHVVAGVASGDINHIDVVEIHPRYRGQGLCTLFVGAIFREYRNLAWKRVEITNGAGQIGERCYKRAGQEAGFTYRCKDLIPDKKTCEDLLFLWKPKKKKG